MTTSETRIDAHHHFWKFDATSHDWITPEMEAIRKDFQPEHLFPQLQQAKIDGCVTVQVEQTAKETLTLLRYADEHSFIKGVVGWVDLRATTVNDQLSFFEPYKKLKGFRHIVQAESDGFLLNPGFLRGIGSLTKFGYTYDILVYPRQLREVIEFVRQFPNQKFILDHLAKPLIKSQVLEPWNKDIRELASMQNVYCKISGMVTEADWSNWKVADITPYLDVILRTFGPQRMIYGSDWPVCLVAATYERQLALVEEFIKPLSASEKLGIMGGNAVRFYNL